MTLALATALAACGAPASDAANPAAVTLLFTPRPVQSTQAAPLTAAGTPAAASAISIITPTAGPGAPPATASATQATARPVAPAAAAPQAGIAVNGLSFEISNIQLTAGVQPIGLIRNAKTGAIEWGLPSGRMVGWHNDSARPGEGGNVVISGHHNIEGKVFENLHQLTGDVTKTCARDVRSQANGLAPAQIKMRNQNQEVIYQITDCKLLLQRGVSNETLLEHGKLMLQDGQDKLTIITCWPSTDNSHRLVLIAKQISSRTI